MPREASPLHGARARTARNAGVQAFWSVRGRFGSFCKKMGVPTPDSVIVELDQTFLDANPALATRFSKPVTQGAHFGSMVVRDTFDNPPTMLINDVSNKADFPKTVVFDVVTENTDRGKASNLLIVPPDHYPQQTHFVCIDH